MRCPQCGLESQVSDGGQSGMDHFAEVQAAYYGEHTVFDNPFLHHLQLQKAAQRLRLLRKHLSGGSILEIGPGGGEFLELALSAEYRVAAVEDSPQLAQRLHDRLGVMVYQGMLEQVDLHGETYDALVSNQVLEHVPDPIQHLRIARSYVKNGGLVFISTPNTGGWPHKLAGNRWPGYSPAHLNLFSAQSLELCLRQTGWRVVEIHTPQDTFEWLRTVHHLRRKTSDLNQPQEAGEVTRRTSYCRARFVLGVSAVVSWPLRRIQSTMHGGSELVMMAEAQ